MTRLLGSKTAERSSSIGKMTLAKSRLSKCTSGLVHFLFVGWILCVLSPLQVEASSGSENGGEPKSLSTELDASPEFALDDPNNLGQLTQLFYRLQGLQQEVQLLRGTLEEQQYRLDRMTREQQERYVGLDKRISELQGQTHKSSSEEPIVKFVDAEYIKGSLRDDAERRV